MTRRITSRSLPAPPASWDDSSKDAWNKLTKVLEQSDLFDLGRRTRPQFLVKGTVSAAVTLDMSTPSVTVLTQVLGQLLIALQASNFVDVREL
jgi:hypothetical protein